MFMDKFRQEKMLNDTMIRSVRIKKNKLKNNNNLNIKTPTVVKTDNVVTGFQGDAGENFISTSGGETKFVSHDFGNDIRGLMFVDKSANNLTFGNFTYEIDFSFKDTTRKLLNDFLSFAFTYLNAVEEYITFISKVKNYDFVLRKIKESAKQNAYFQNQLFVESSVIMSEIKFYMFKMSEQQKEKEQMRNYNLINPETCTIESLSFFVKEYKDLYNKFLSFCNFDRGAIKNNYKKEYRPKNTYFHNRIFVSHKFKNIVTPSSSKYHYTIPNIQEGDTVKNGNINPTGFSNSKTRQNFTGRANPRLNSIISEASLSRGSTSRGSTSFTFSSKSETQTQTEEKERFKNISDYLGKETNLNSFNVEEKCEPSEDQPIVNTEIETQVATNIENIQKEMSQVAIRLELLDGFKESKYQKKILTQPIWSPTSTAPTDRTSIIKQNRIVDNLTQISYPYPGKYLLLNNKESFLVRNYDPDFSTDELLAKTRNLSGVNPSFTQSIIVNNYDPASVVSRPQYGISSYAASPVSPFDQATQPNPVTQNIDTGTSVETQSTSMAPAAMPQTSGTGGSY
jgi:hypothetical protein